MVQFVCDYCGNAFLQYPSNRVDPPYFCNRTCYHAWRRARMETVCEICGKSFVTANAHKRRFCSRACGGIWASNNRLKEHAPLWKGGIPERTCEVCNKVYQPVTYPSQDNKRGQQHFFCSHTCHGAWASIHRSGSNHPLWTGGRKKYRYYGPNWKQQKRLARKRDAYTCRKCGQKQIGRALDVHHIKPFREFDYIPDVNDNYLAANDLTNLISLCKKCHGIAETSGIKLSPLVQSSQVQA